MKKIMAISLPLIAIALTFCLLPGGPLNRHEWLNETMALAKPPWSSTIQAGTYNVTYQGNMKLRSTDIFLQADKTASIVQASAFNFLAIYTPDHRCFVVDICLKHGELRTRPCN